MNFTEMLIRAKGSDVKAISEIFTMYRPMLIKGAIVNGVFDESVSDALI